MEEDKYSELLVELECPICTNYMTPPIRQCNTGHSICETCRRKLPRCPLCQGMFTESKNISLEALARKMHYPCINKDSGCTMNLAFDKREQHEAVCQYKAFKCGMDRCPWMGKYEEIEQHWDSKKMTSRPYTISNVCHTKLKPDFSYVNLVKAHNKLFWFKCKGVMGRVFWAVQYIGSGNDADKYFYQVELFKPGFTRCKAILSDYCHKAGIENEELFKEGKCLSMTFEAIDRYTGEDHVLIYYLRVYEDRQKAAEGDAEAATALNYNHHHCPPTGVVDPKERHHGKNRAHSQGPPKNRMHQNFKPKPQAYYKKPQ